MADVTLQADITGLSDADTDSILSVYTYQSLEAAIDGTSTVSPSITRERSLAADITSSTDVSGKLRYGIVTLSCTINGEATISDAVNRDIRITQTKKSKIVGNSTVTYYVNEPATSNGSTTITKANLVISNLLRLSSVKRQPFILPTIDIDAEENVTTLFKIMKLYQSLDNADVILESVKRQSQEELDAYIKTADTDITWYQDAGIPKPLPGVSYPPNTNFGGWIDANGNVTATVGQRAFIGNNASGIFRGKDGWFAIYLGIDRK